MTTRCTPALVAALLLGLAGCSTMTAKSDFDTSFDFTAVKQYAWISDHPLIVADGQTRVSPLLEGRVKRAIDTVLQRKGYRYVEARDRADVVVSFTVGARDEIRVDSYPAPYHAGWGRWGWGGPYYYNEVDVRQYTEGRLAIDVFHVATRSPVWHGWATKNVSQKDQENPEPLINAAVERILAAFPPE